MADAAMKKFPDKFEVQYFYPKEGWTRLGGSDVWRFAVMMLDEWSRAWSSVGLRYHWRIVCLAAVVLLCGCESVSTVGVTGGYTGSTDTWTVGVTITFKGQPSMETVAALEAAGAVRTKSNPQVWVMGHYSSRNDAQGKAVDFALKDGAAITPLE